MFTALIVYGSTTGNTEAAAEMAARLLTEGGGKVTTLNAADADAGNLCGDYDLVLFGCSTWGDDSIELQDDFIPLFDAFDSIGAKGKDTAVFGCGDSSYTYYCGAVDAISERLQELGANVIDTLKIDGAPQQEKQQVEAWVKGLLESKK